jgi:hypothetical protein
VIHNLAKIFNINNRTGPLGVVTTKLLLTGAPAGLFLLESKGLEISVLSSKEIVLHSSHTESSQS